VEAVLEVSAAEAAAAAALVEAGDRWLCSHDTNSPLRT
jgi:hypothetical protein